MMTMMIALVGEQPLPNFFPISHYQPEEVLFVYTKKTLPYYQHLRDVLQDSIKVFALEVDPYDIPNMTVKLRATLVQLIPVPATSLIFNITGGTKPMLLAAYQIAQEFAASTIYLQSEGKQTRVYNYTWKDRQLQIKDERLVPECITLQNIFDLHYGPENWRQDRSGNDDGGNFERAIADVLRAHGYEVLTNVKALDNQVEIDIAIRLNNQYGIIEAKQGRKRGFKAIQQLITAWRSLGTYVQKFHIITQAQEEQHKVATDVLGIKVVSLLSYDKATKTFSSADQALLLDGVEKALKA